MSPAFGVAAAALAAAWGWPASAIIFAFSTPAGGPPRACPRCAAPAAMAGRVRPRARCRACLTPLGPPPLLIAAPLALLAAAAAVFVHPWLVACAACWLVACAVPLAAIDIAVRRLPDVLTGAAFGGTFAFLLAASAAGDRWPDLARSGAGGLAVGGLFALLALARPGSAGLGDAKLGLSVGALAGWLGWPVLVLAVLAGFLLAAMYGLGLLASGRASLRSTVAYGPFLLAGCFAAVLLAGSGGSHLP